MNQTTFQPAEIYDSNGNIIQQGAFGINTPFASSTGDGVYDYIVNNLNALKDMIAAGYIAVATLPASGQTNKYYVVTEGANAGKCYIWTGSAWQELTTQINGKSAYEIAVEHGFIGTEQQWLDSFTADAIAAADRAEAAMETIETGLETLEGIDARFANIEDHAQMTDSNVEATKKRISNVEKLLQGNLYDYQTDDAVAYEKTVPAGAMPYASIEQIGGKTLVWNQIVYNGNFADSNGWSITAGYTYSVTDNTLTVTKSVGTTAHLNVQNTSATATNPIVGHKYLVSAILSTDNDAVIRFLLGGVTGYEHFLGATPTRYNEFFTAQNNTGKAVVYCQNTRMSEGASIIAQNFMCFDLTLMFGAGNEPTTVAEFTSQFPASYYPYNAGTLLSAGVTSVVSKKADTTTIATYPIPAEVQAVEGYGWSAGSVYNYIDYERKVFVKNVGRVDLGTLNWTTVSNNRFRAELDSVPLLADNNSYPIAICPKYEGTTPNNYINYDDVFHFSSTIHAIYICDTSYSDVATFTSAVSGVYMNYALATPIETDISQYLTDNLIEVDAGGTLTFENSNGDDYHIPVPSEVTYMIDLQEAIENGN